MTRSVAGAVVRDDPPQVFVADDQETLNWVIALHLVAHRAGDAGSHTRRRVDASSTGARERQRRGLESRRGSPSPRRPCGCVPHRLATVRRSSWRAMDSAIEHLNVSSGRPLSAHPGTTSSRSTVTWRSDGATAGSSAHQNRRSISTPHMLMCRGTTPSVEAARHRETPIEEVLVGLTRIELVTSSLSGMRSNRLSYSPGPGVEG